MQVTIQEPGNGPGMKETPAVEEHRRVIEAEEEVEVVLNAEHMTISLPIAHGFRMLACRIQE